MVWNNTAPEQEPCYKKTQLRSRSHAYENRELRNRSLSSIKELPAVIFKKRYKNSIIESYKNHE